MVISTLMELKSKLLLPGEVDIGEEIEALKEDLLAKVLVHRRLSQVLDALEFRRSRRSEMHGRPNQLREKETILTPLEQQNPFLLFSSLSGILEMARQDTLRVNYDIRPIDEYYVWLDDVWKDKDFTLIQLIKARKDLLDATGVIIAVLELVRLGSLIMHPLEGDVGFTWGDPELKRQEMEMDPTDQDHDDQKKESSSPDVAEVTSNEQESESNDSDSSDSTASDE
jgi:chromatin segregation and condensation protein Rec8/ScpA/Scc1 (kleisin family)